MIRHVGRLVSVGLGAAFLVSCASGAPELTSPEESRSPGTATAEPDATGSQAIGDAPPAGLEGELVAIGNGGAIGEAQKACILDPLEELFGIDVTYQELTGPPALAKLIAEQNNQQVDLHIASTQMVEGTRAGVYAENDPEIVTNLERIPELSKYPDNIGAVLRWTAYGIVYREDLFAENNIPAPTSYEDFFRPELADRIVLQDVSGAGGVYQVIAFADAYGGSQQDLDPGFEALTRLQPLVVTFGSGSTVSQAVQTGEAWMAFHAQSVVGSLQESGVPVKYVEPVEGAYAVDAGVVVVEGAPHPVAAQVALNYALGVEAQECLANAPYQLSAPVNPDATFPPELAESYVTLDDLEDLVIVDRELLATERASINDRFNREILGQ